MNENLEKLAKAMFLPSLPCNPIPFCNGLAEGCKLNGTDWIRSDEAKMIMHTILQQMYGQAYQIDSFKVFQDFYFMKGITTKKNDERK